MPYQTVFNFEWIRKRDLIFSFINNGRDELLKILIKKKSLIRLIMLKSRNSFLFFFYFPFSKIFPKVFEGWRDKKFYVNSLNASHKNFPFSFIRKNWKKKVNVKRNWKIPHEIMQVKFFFLRFLEEILKGKTFLFSLRKEFSQPSWWLLARKGRKRI